MTYSPNHIRAFAASRETSYEIAQAIFDLFPGKESTTWDSPTAKQRKAVISAAWKMAEIAKETLFWGDEEISRDA